VFPLIRTSWYFRDFVVDFIMAYVTKRYSTCEISDQWQVQGFKVVKDKGQKGRVVGVVDRKVFEAKTNNAEIKIIDDRAGEFTFKIRESSGCFARRTHDFISIRRNDEVRRCAAHTWNSLVPAAS